MNAYASESIIGPPSERIHIKEFLNRCATSRAGNGSAHPSELEAEWNKYSDLAKQQIEEECSTRELQRSLDDTISSPLQYAHLMRNYETTTESIKSSLLSGHSKLKVKKGKRSGVNAPEEHPLPPEIQRLQENLDNIPLKCWSYPFDTGLFLGAQKNSDLNALLKLKVGTESTERPDAILFVSVYSRLSWGNHLSCSSQHAVLASQTIGDLYDVIPCVANELTTEFENTTRGQGISAEKEPIPVHRGSVICIEDIAYGDGQSEEDYSEKLLQLLNLKSDKNGTELQKGGAMHDRWFSDVILCLNKPYWLLHQGLCEHFLIFDAVRILSHNDPCDGYPLTLHISPPILDLCMACSRVPATLSVVGDLRLGQSPFKICKPCWDTFGTPESAADVKVVSLPKHYHGW